ncbi:MAG TPA: hypothetical protein VMV77_11555 [Bacteroidales bacterium]|nr:hypothetical protein [Bacteroidales bacterium]
MKTYSVTIFAVVFFGLIISGCGEKKSAVTEESLLGEWYTIKGDVEAYSFLKDEKNYIFVGTVGMHPVIYGTWKIDKGMFVITIDNGTTTEYSFALSNDTLSLNDGEEIYTRTAPLEAKYPEVQILVDISSDFSDLKFSAPQPANLKWGYWIDSTSTAREFYLNGYSISVTSTISSGDIKNISDYLQDYGYETDTSFMSEICDGYWNNNQIVTVCTSMDPEATNDSIYINITSGLVIK